jgi:hypothetical protein
MPDHRRLAKSEVIYIIRRAQYTPEMIDEIAAQLPDPVDLDECASLLARYGMTRGQLMDRLGSSP